MSTPTYSTDEALELIARLDLEGLDLITSVIEEDVWLYSADDLRGLKLILDGYRFIATCKIKRN